METLINLKIEKIKEDDGKEYYLATSEDVQGLLAQGDTVEEVLEIAAEVATIMFEIDEGWNNQPA